MCPFWLDKITQLPYCSTNTQVLPPILKKSSHTPPGGLLSNFKLLSISPD